MKFWVVTTSTANRRGKKASVVAEGNFGRIEYVTDDVPELGVELDVTVTYVKS